MSLSSVCCHVDAGRVSGGYVLYSVLSSSHLSAAMWMREECLEDMS
jgi:hypothetical protein